MEPATAIAAAKTAPTAFAVTKAAIKRVRLFGTYQVDWIRLDGGGEGLNATEVEAVHQFLASLEMRPLLSLLSVTLLSPEAPERLASIESIRGTARNNAERWCVETGAKWFDQWSAIWQSVEDIYSGTSPNLSEESLVALNEFGQFIQSPLGQAKNSARSIRYLSRLSDLASDIQRVATALRTAEEIRDALSEAPTPPIITYTQTTKPATFSDLYITRSLRKIDDDEQIQTSDLGPSGGPFRLVVQGTPGAGKSTFVRHLRHELATDTWCGQAALLLTVRQYFTSGRNQSIHEHLAEQIRATLNLDTNERALRDALTLGLVVVIFDGLDEITDINHRADMVQRIVTFSNEYPATSILVTSRTIGYERAPLPPETFPSLVLEQYSPEQSEEYVQRWFTFNEREDLVSEFIRESQTVEDLKANPLLLSLLCILYRERGSIPRRRRDIYASCADLLFHTWDSHRHIEQFEELHTNGDRIMQEIARWVYGSSTAQNGLPESVIEKCIGNFLRDTAGVADGEARRRAAEFLEFCATRAWLLATIGNEHGERIFGFTHRTFFEYFAAEAYARQSADPSKVATEIVASYKRDATSVFPELLLQAFDQKVDRGASDAFKLICAEGGDDVLILRLIEGVPLPFATRAIGFARVMQFWKTGISEASFVSLLSLNPDARNHFVNQYLTPNADTFDALRFLGAWAGLDLEKKSSRFINSWQESVDICVDAHVSELSIQGEPSALHVWLWHQGVFPDPKDISKNLLLTSSTLGPRLGYLWLVFEEVLGLTPAQAPDNTTVKRPDIEAITAAAVRLARGTAARVTHATGMVLGEAAAIRYRSPTTEHDLEELLPDGALKWSIYYLFAALYEVDYRDIIVEDAVTGLYGERLSIFLSYRTHSITDGVFEDEDVERADVQVKAMPPWLQDWARARRSFVLDYLSGI